MKIPTSITFVTLLVFVQAAPLAPKEPRLEARASINDCGSSTFINQSSGDSPLVADCQVLVKNIAGGGTWTVPAVGRQHQLAQYGTCAFGIQGGQVLNIAYVGNQDIIYIINSSIAKFKWKGKIGAKGTMSCQTPTKATGNTPMTWAIYHT
ncbi:hypothetical protein CBS147339_4225 [Penicillium roqueforti]|uniref:Genomic scaffold, ProqFM164S01 n=1 Tax=Penicillium roqueforti (strain FM164) TaxID=1365484 RepID=W6QDF9_PENRF|nr:hypothetical protein DTO012A8_9233 [Penicillium roqueforti]CDM27637.1 unnamed protein product [Penicillium roqueforti FM164]KAI3078060.1 hypothetical protein CBS147339_4225 [Penicillium roqueforti]KAI3105000.1 hypothetical protein CBS147338_1448 [Penicillium roqueforti]KAI3134393.1 hypothetical protein CBS147325_8119 [Penicillium roqueforti]